MYRTNCKDLADCLSIYDADLHGHPHEFIYKMHSIPSFLYSPVGLYNRLLLSPLQVLLIVCLFYVRWWAAALDSLNGTTMRPLESVLKADHCGQSKLALSHTDTDNNHWQTSLITFEKRAANGGMRNMKSLSVGHKDTIVG